MGLAFSTLLVSFFTAKYKVKTVLGISLFINLISCFLFAFSYRIELIYTSRFLMGFSQAFWVVYAPVWTNNNSPINSNTTWVGILQGFSPLG